MNLNNLIRQCSEITESEFGIRPEKSSCFTYQGKGWKRFIAQSNLRQALGTYRPRSLSAHLNESSGLLPVNFLHEYFGHGLMCEHSLIGKNLVELEQEMAGIEKKIIGVRELPENRHFRIDSTNPYFDEYNQASDDLKNFFNRNRDNYEGFAMWLEHYLAERTGNSSLFDEKINRVHPKDKKLFEQFMAWEEEYGKFAFIYQLGFPKFYDKTIITDIIRKLYREESKSIDLMLLYGSGKPYSDIDLFIVSDKITPAYNIWLDVYSKSKEELNHCLKLLDISVTDPIFSGEVIAGSREQLTNLQKRVINMPITEEAIAYNLQKSDEQDKIALTYPENSSERRTALSYHRTLRLNAEELKKGNKLLTLSNINKKYYK